jgi:GGDEF domain-containing protein
VDADHFREINDTLDHAAGDDVLTVTAERLRAAAKPGERRSNRFRRRPVPPRTR